ncbi:hypothetical protein ABNC92_20850 [Paenibacillus larvae]|uniref:Uncharacterized protein n=1 Tax=Paenibacillus phage phiIBB_P123 TaxID=1337877 RepID=R9VW35_9CAUD|nr:hypothetical protein IBBPl23_41 [Paenibacillus phage phiIBB_P123]AGN89358.1 hypothetical protein IBBPl23_41 [Paenibacillus phage phiIBB_P123]
MDSELEQIFKVQIIYAYDNAKHAHNEVFSDREDKHVIIGHLSIASSYINSAKSIYACNLDRLGRPEFDDFFHCFNTFIKEAMNCIRTDHSHQWTSIEYERMKEEFKGVALLLGIEGIE